MCPANPSGSSPYDMVARRRHFGIKGKQLGSEIHAAARRPLQRDPGDSVKTITTEHEFTRDLVAVGQHDHRPLGDTYLSHCTAERDLAAGGAKLLDQVGHQQLLWVDVMRETPARSP
jgi:hypothetical protein